ncbi:TetR family transcriptional regulator [Mycobacteroides abscessus subsp. abscessus]|nr:TetR family transcriptional regulator [Mycobacteroides abscessus subsp. abscessus]
MVERILDAGRRVLLEVGYERASTARIAHEAGISPGSVYQYFSNKDDIFQAIAQEMQSQLKDSVMDRIRSRVSNSDVASVAEEAIGAVVEALATQRDILRVALLAQPSSDFFGSDRQSEVRQLIDLAGMYLMINRGHFRDVSNEGAAWLGASAVAGAIIAFTLNESPPIETGQFVRELTDMTAGYFASRPVKSADAPGALNP